MITDITINYNSFANKLISSNSGGDHMTWNKQNKKTRVRSYTRTTPSGKRVKVRSYMRRTN